MRSTAPTLFGVLTLLSFSTVGLRVAAAQPVSVCELIRHSERYRDKILTVKGTYFHGPHGATLATEECGFRSRYAPFSLGAAADLDFYDATEPLPESAVKLFDQASMRRLHNAVAETMVAGAQDVAFRLTVLAFVKVADNYTISDTGRGNYEGTGFGFMGRYPVQVVVLRVQDFKASKPKARK